MKLYKYFPAVFIVSFFAVACEKNNSNVGLAALNIINANTNAPSVLVYLKDSPDSFYQNRAPVYYASFLEYGTPSGARPLNIYNKTDTTKPLLKTTLNLNAGGIYSLYLAGNAPQVDTLFVQDIIPVRHDSSAGVRFVNLSAGGLAVTVNLEGNPPDQSEFPALAYKSITDFKSYPVIAGMDSYQFEIRDQATGELLTSFPWYYSLFKNNTLVICGSKDPDSPTPINVFQVNNF